MSNSEILLYGRLQLLHVLYRITNILFILPDQPLYLQRSSSQLCRSPSEYFLTRLKQKKKELKEKKTFLLKRNVT